MLEVMEFADLKNLVIGWFKAAKPTSEDNPQVIFEYVPSTENEPEHMKVTITQHNGWAKVDKYYKNGDATEDIVKLI